MLWAVNGGGRNDDACYAIVADESCGDVYLSGSYHYDDLQDMASFGGFALPRYYYATYFVARFHHSNGILSLFVCVYMYTRCLESDEHSIDGVSHVPPPPFFRSHFRHRYVVSND